jgi:hypothetical protein
MYELSVRVNSKWRLVCIMPESLKIAKYVHHYLIADDPIWSIGHKPRLRKYTSYVIHSSKFKYLRGVGIDDVYLGCIDDSEPIT